MTWNFLIFSPRCYVHLRKLTCIIVTFIADVTVKGHIFQIVFFISCQIVVSGPPSHSSVFAVRFSHLSVTPKKYKIWSGRSTKKIMYSYEKDLCTRCCKKAYLFQYFNVWHLHQTFKTQLGIQFTFFLFPKNVKVCVCLWRSFPRVLILTFDFFLFFPVLIFYSSLHSFLKDFFLLEKGDGHYPIWSKSINLPSMSVQIAPCPNGGQNIFGLCTHHCLPFVLDCISRKSCLVAWRKE